LQYENVVFPDSIGFQCRGCSVCCRNQPPDINFKEQQKIEAKGFMNFLENPKDPNNRNIRRSKDGSCFFLTDENKCKIQAEKPLICILEPFVITDFDYRTNRIFLSLNPLAAKNCKGIFSGDIIALKEIANAAQTIIKECSEIIAQKTGLPVTDKKVAFLTNKLVKRFQST
jgi:Fe-S-cluster containining protein